MIAKILASATSDFKGVNYNEKKNENGKSELLEARNFDGLSEFSSKEDYKNYLKSFALKNTRVKNPQFHATLSCKGTEYNMEQMKDYALQWIDLMGYGQQPFLIYAHNDTDNNHVHVVSVRVDADGKKISDKFERIRSQQALQKIMGEDFSKKVKQQYDNFSAYNFTTEKQFELLMEQAGWIVTRDDKNINLIKGGQLQMSVKTDEITAKIEHNREIGTDRDRKKQIVALLYKYKVGLDYGDLKEVMHRRFGVDLVFHCAKDHATPYGYTVIDHTSRSVYKGSEILPLQKIIQTPEERERAQAAKSVIMQMTGSKERLTLKELMAEMKHIGYVVDKNGYVKISDDAGRPQIVYSIDKDILDGLKYNDRVGDAKLFCARTHNEAVAIGKVCNINVDDVIIEHKQRDLKLAYMYGKLIDDYNTGLDVKDVLAARMMQVERVGDTTYFVDKRHHEIYSDRQWEYDKRLIVANKFNIRNEKELELVAKLYDVKQHDISSVRPDKDRNYYYKYMRDYLSGKLSNDDLKGKNIFVFNHDNTVYMVDTARHFITSENDYTFSNGSGQNIQSNNVSSFDDMTETIAASILTGVAQMLFERTPAADGGSGHARDLSEKKKKKKKQFKL